MAGGEFWNNLLDTISGKTKQDIVKEQIAAAEAVAVAQAEADKAKSSPEALAQRYKLVIGVTYALVAGTILIIFMYYKFR